MERKATTKDKFGKLTQRVSANLAAVNKLCETTPTPAYAAGPDPSILKNLLAECEDSDFWQNFKKAAPIMFCLAIEEDQNLKQQRDMSFIEELLKTKSILTLLDQKLKDGKADIDVIEYSIATKMLEHKLAILNSLNISVDSDGDEKVSFNLFGMNKSIVIDKAKMREAITIQDTTVVERQATPEDNKVDLPNIPTTGITEEEFLERAVEAIGQVKKTDKKTLARESFIKVFKYTGDFAKLKNKDFKKQAQQKRCEFFEKDSQAYLKALKENIADEEKAYESSATIMFEKLCITPECFQRTQEELMNDPYVSMELFNLGISMEQPSEPAPAALNLDKTVELVLASNDYAFDLFKKDYISQMRADPMMMPVLISCIAHDWVKVQHGFSEEEFKAALFQHKIYENPKVSEHMQMKQMELLSLAASQNPMMGGYPGMGGMDPSMMGGYPGMDPSMMGFGGGPGMNF